MTRLIDKIEARIKKLDQIPRRKPDRRVLLEMPWGDEEPIRVRVEPETLAMLDKVYGHYADTPADGDHTQEPAD